MEAFFCVGTMVGHPLGALVRRQLGYTPVFTLSIGLTVVTMLYVTFFIKDSIHFVSEERKEAILEERLNKEIKCDRGKLFIQSYVFKVFAVKWERLFLATSKL